jgi:ABC-type lipoprotein release transport system permease subunit
VCSVTAVWLRFRAETRARRRAWLVLAVFAGVTCGVVIALAAASARTASAYHRYLVASNHADAYVDPGLAFGGDESLDLERIARLPEVAAAERTAMLAVVARSASGRPIYPNGPDAVQFMAPMDGRSDDTIDRQKVLRGRIPDPRRPDEALLDAKAARALEVDAGDSITLRVASHRTLWDGPAIPLTADPRTATGGPLVTVRVVGVSANSRASVDAGVVHLSPGFYAAHGGAELGAFLFELETRLVHRDADLKRFEADVRKIAGKRRYGFFEPNEARLDVQASMDTLALALRIVAIIAAVAALLLVGQASIRQALLDAADRRVLRALGMTRGALVGLAAARALAIALPAAVLAVAVAYALSPLSPVGWARELEPDPGLSFAVSTLLAGGILVLAAMVLAGVLAGAWAIRPERPRTTVEAASALARAELPPAVAAGLRMALVRRGAAAGVPVRTTLAAAIVAVCVGVTALVFAASLQHLLDTPRLFGRTWDFEMAGGGPPLEHDLVQRLTSDPRIAAVATGAVGPVQLEGRTTTANAMDNVKGAVLPTVLSGRAPRTPDELLVGDLAARRLGLELGDTVRVGSGAHSERLRVVGVGVVPASKWGKLGEGVALQFRALRRIQPEVQANAAEIVLVPGGSRAATLASLRALGDSPSTAVTPAEVTNFGGVSSLPFLIAGVFGAAAAAALAHALLTSLRRRRRDLAVLKTLGFTRRQVMETISCQATTIAAVGLLVGLPLGLGIARFAWYVFASDLGVVPESVVPFGPTLLIVPAAVVLANVVAALPASAAARTPAAAVLRAE